MNTLIDQPVSARCTAGIVHIQLESGRELRFSVKGNPRLEGRTDEELSRIELSPFGLHWPELNEDLSISGIAQGRYGQQ